MRDPTLRMCDRRFRLPHRNLRVRPGALAPFRLGFSDGCGVGACPQLGETLIHELLQEFEVGRRVHIAGKAEKRSAVIGEDGAVDAHQAADRHLGIPRQHLVTHEVERDLRAGDVGANDVAQAQRQLAGHRSNIFPEGVGQS